MLRRETHRKGPVGMNFRYDEIGERLHAYRIGARLSVDEVATCRG